MEVGVRVKALSWSTVLLLVGFSLRTRVMGSEQDTSSDVCPRNDDLFAAGSFLRSRELCLVSAPPVESGWGKAGRDLARVIEGDEATLHKALSSIHKNKNEFMAVLFYASWCPFSKTCRPNFDISSSLFPEIQHFAFEESAIRPSILSRYGVHGFPTLFILNSTVRVRYHGSRKVNSFIAFYSNVTGLQPKPLGHNSLRKSAISLNETEEKENMDNENCPFSWARSPEKLLQQDTYLALATVFVMIRLLYVLSPKLAHCVKRTWRRHIQFTCVVTLSQVCLEQFKRTLGRLNPYCKRHNLEEGAINARTWASKSLASVSIGEPSSLTIPPLVEDVEILQKFSEQFTFNMIAALMSIAVQVGVRKRGEENKGVAANTLQCLYVDVKLGCSGKMMYL